MVNKRGIIFIAISLGIIVLDQLTKFLFVHLDLYSQNYGAAFSLLQNKTTLMVWAAVIVVGLIIYYLDEFPEKSRIFAALLIGGTISNMLDRLIRGFVIDFIDLKVWPSFNIADAAITIGIIGILIYSIMDGKGHKAKK